MLFSLSIAWSPELRELQISKRQNSANESHDENSRMRQCNNARGKAAIVISLWKLFLTPLVAVMFAKIYKTVELDRFSAGFKAIDTSNPSLCILPFISLPVSLVTILVGSPVRSVCRRLDTLFPCR